MSILEFMWNCQIMITSQLCFAATPIYRLACGRALIVVRMRRPIVFKAGISDAIRLARREHINLCEQQFGLFDGVPNEELPALFLNKIGHYQKCIEREG